MVGKNYRVQNIQLSKISLAGRCRQSVNVGLIGVPLMQHSSDRPDVGARETDAASIRSPKLFPPRALRFDETSPALL